MMRIEAGAPMPTLRIRSVSGEELDIGLAGSWEMVVVYRGKHCPLCCSYLSALNRLVSQLLTLTRRRWSISTSIVFESGFPRSGQGGPLKAIPPRFPLSEGSAADSPRAAIQFEVNYLNRNLIGIF